MPKIPNIAKQRLRALSSSGHPDADLLTAFAERRLRRREYDEVLGHLAECAGCREVAALTASLQPARRPDPEASRNWWSFNVVRWAGVAMVLVAGTALIANYPRFHELQISPPLSPSRASEESPAGKKGDGVASSASPVGARPIPPKESPRSLNAQLTRSEVEAETPRTSLTSAVGQQGYSRGRLSAEQTRDKDRRSEKIDAPGKNKREKAEGETAAGIGGAGEAMKPAAGTIQAVPKLEAPGLYGSSTKVMMNRAPVPPPPPPPAKAASNVNSLDQAVSEVRQLKRPAGEGTQLPATPQTEAPAKGAKNQAGASSSATGIMAQPMPQPLPPAYGQLSKSDRRQAPASVASRPTSPEGSNSGTVSPSISATSQAETVSVEAKTADAGKEMSNMEVIPVAGRQMIPLLEPAPGGLYLWSITPGGGVQRCLAPPESGAGACSEVTLTPKAKAAAIAQFGSTVWIGTKAPAGKNNGLLFSSSDNGITFTRVLGLWTGDIVRMSLPGPESGVIFMSTKEQWTTSDGGKTWKRVVP